MQRFQRASGSNSNRYYDIDFDSETGLLYGAAVGRLFTWDASTGELVDGIRGVSSGIGASLAIVNYPPAPIPEPSMLLVFDGLCAVSLAG